MTTREAIDLFLAQKRLALAGASRGGKKMGRLILKELTRKGYDIQPVHPAATEIAGRKLPK
ncbi:MAG: CoA-binding protein [bacterium]